VAVTAAFLAARRTEIALLAELTAFQAAVATLNATSAADYGRYWQAAFGDAQAGLSPAYRLRKAIRDTVRGAADGTQSALDLEGAYRTLVGEYVSEPPAPTNFNDDAALLQQILTEDALS
jgi:hypothetical protein